MECKKYFQFDKRKYTQDGIVSFYLSGSGSFVITGPDWPSEAGFVSPEQDERIVEEFLEALFVSKDSDSLPLISSDISSYADIPNHPEVLADWINDDNTPFRWKYETGYKLKEISFSGFYPSDERSTIRAGFSRKLGETVRSINMIIEKQRALVPGCYHIDNSGGVIFDWDRIDRGNTEFWALQEQCNELFDRQMGLLEELRSFKSSEIDELNKRSIELYEQVPTDKLCEYTQKIKQSMENGVDLDPKEQEYYEGIEQIADKLTDEAEKLDQEADELMEEYERLCELLGED